jgi:hypothetical protein
MSLPRLQSDVAWVTRGFARACLVVVAACTMAIPLTASAGTSAGTSERWTATSKTSMSITGNVTFSPQKIRFSNGRVMALSAPEQVASFKVFDETFEATIYRVVKPAALKLKNGNYLCGAPGKPPATFVVVWKPNPLPGDKDPRGMAAFSGTETPVSAPGPGLCGTYAYQLR